MKLSERRGQATPVLARDGMIRAELSEDRDHDAAQEVATVGVVGLPDDGLQSVERRLEVTVVPRGERTRERPRAIGPILAEVGEQPGSRREARCLEVGGKPIEELERLVGISALEEETPQLAGRGGVAGVEVQRL